MAPDGCASEIRRFVMPYELHRIGGPYKFDKFTTKITSLFPSLLGKTFTLTWKDEEGDDIVMSSDEELSQAFQSIQHDLLKVYIHSSCTSDHGQQQERSRGKKTSEHKSSKGCGEKPLHPGVICDGCDGQIRGNRYKCLECDDYDLCETCMSRDQHPAHNLLRIVDPSKHPSPWNRFGRKPWKHMFGPHARRFSAGHGPWFPHMHHQPGHGKRTETERPATADADQFVAAREQSAEFLRYVGQTVAAFLDPLGIDVSVDVEHRQQGEAKKDQQTEPKNNQGETGTSDVEMSAPTPQEVDLTSPSSSPAPQPENSQNRASPAPSSKDSETAEGDWTMVAEALAAVSGSQTEAKTAMETEEQAAPTPSEPVHSNPKIAEAVDRMLSMGFSNDGGWLSRLVEAKDGNIGSVLDTLHPLHQQGRNMQQ